MIPRVAFLFCLGFLLVAAALVTSGPANDDPKAPQPAGAAGPQRAEINLVQLAKTQAAAPKEATPSRAIHAPKRIPAKAPPAPMPPGKGGQKGEVDLTAAAKAQAQAPDQPGAAKAIHAPKGIPQQLKAAQPSPQPAATFTASLDLFSPIPADTNGAAGPNHLLVTLNTEVVVQKRNGQEVLRLKLDNFWKSLNQPAPPATFDPKVLFDTAEKRWIFVACGDAQQTTSSLLVAVSKTDDPTAGWFTYRYFTDPDKKLWFDYPSIGFNKNWLVIQGNMFAINENDQSFRSQIYVFNKADLYAGKDVDPAGTDPAKVRFKLITDPALGLTQAPEINGDNSESMFLVESDANDSTNKLKLFKITGTVDDPKLSTAGADLTIPPTPWNFGAPGGGDFAPQKGSPRKFQADDSRVQALVSRNGLLWCVQTVFLPAGDGATRCAVQWCQIDPNAADPAKRLKQSGRIDDAEGKFFRAFPSLAVNTNEDVLIGYSRFHGNEFAGCAYAVRKKDDPVNTFRDEVVFKKGKADYFKTLSGNENRWGDYSNTVVDPNGIDFWTIQMYAEQHDTAGVHWGCQWANVKP